MKLPLESYREATSVAGGSAAVVAGVAGSLRRRNSDPAPGDLRPVDLRPVDPRSAGFIGQTENGLFRIAGHRYVHSLSMSLSLYRYCYSC